MTFRGAPERVLGQYAEPVPPASVREMLGRLEALDSTLARIQEGENTLQANQEEMSAQIGELAQQVEATSARLDEMVERVATLIPQLEELAQLWWELLYPHTEAADADPSPAPSPEASSPAEQTPSSKSLFCPLLPHCPGGAGALRRFSDNLLLFLSSSWAKCHPARSRRL